MSDRFDHTLERTLESKGDEPGDAGLVRRIELITGTGRRKGGEARSAPEAAGRGFRPRKRLDKVPAKLTVIVTKRPKLACRDCDKNGADEVAGIIQAPTRPRRSCAALRRSTCRTCSPVRSPVPRAAGGRASRCVLLRLWVVRSLFNAGSVFSACASALACSVSSASNASFSWSSSIFSERRPNMARRISATMYSSFSLRATSWSRSAACAARSARINAFKASMSPGSSWGSADGAFAMTRTSADSREARFEPGLQRLHERLGLLPWGGTLPPPARVRRASWS